MSNFSDRPLYTGTLTGIRSFKVDDYGRLTAVNYPGVWTPGENVATCRSDAIGSIWSPLVSMMRISVETAPAEKKEAEGPKHQVASHSCGCGFYAYYDRRHNPHHDKGQVLGLVEGYGVMTVGSRGFRAEKARIVALVKTRGAFPFDRLAARCYNRGPLLAGLAAMVFILSTVFGVSYIPKLGWWEFAFLPGVLAGAALLYLSFRSLSVHGRTLANRWGLVRRNYPDVPVYRSVRAAIAAHPLTPPAPLDPDSDPDFWTRSAS